MTNKRIMIISLSIILFLLISVVFYFLIFKERKTESSLVEDSQQIPNYEIIIKEDNPLLDTDGDGIPDVEEIKLGTSITDFDTDGDGISDYDEINIWGTDPLNPDTDGDGFPDGLEIVTGYNPLGEGKLNQ
ncbi:MAG TPA: hypothetical protein PK831_00045 [Candidatus Magasanikbacteria bacterium]|jgi:hypothetical protein|nr:hypothetical protein [Candidatus Magasanikbacteria bacterium]